jgi:hypothetical protein
MAVKYTVKRIGCVKPDVRLNASSDKKLCSSRMPMMNC